MFTYGEDIEESAYPPIYPPSRKVLGSFSGPVRHWADVGGCFASQLFPSHPSAKPLWGWLWGRPKNKGVFIGEMAEAVRFELTVRSPPRQFSRLQP
jgi:hypothetical protein